MSDKNLRYISMLASVVSIAFLIIGQEKDIAGLINITIGWTWIGAVLMLVMWMLVIIFAIGASDSDISTNTDIKDRHLEMMTDIWNKSPKDSIKQFTHFLSAVMICALFFYGWFITAVAFFSGRFVYWMLVNTAKSKIDSQEVDNAEAS